MGLLGWFAGWVCWVGLLGGFAGVSVLAMASSSSMASSRPDPELAGGNDRHLLPAPVGMDGADWRRLIVCFPNAAALDFGLPMSQRMDPAGGAKATGKHTWKP